MAIDTEPRTWRRAAADGDGGSYMISTDPHLVQTDEINRMFASDVMWWAQGLPRDDLAKALRNSLCFSLYWERGAAATDRSSAEQAGRRNDEKTGNELGLAQVGFARLVTDGVTFAWLTDVYVLEAHQGRGLARFLMESIKDVISEWRYLRRFMLLASDSMDLYRKTLGVKDWRELGTDAVGVGVLEGPSGQHPSH
ncbi:aralkylamine N-acetyltransferase [Microdochium nivale]|nr:aralkylamine N-acetyltransferase [Microdochium nivale]